VRVHFLAAGWDDFVYWCGADAKTLRKILDLIENIRRDPFKGLGKPEPLKRDWDGWWSRRIDQEHRLVNAVQGKMGDDQRLTIAQCRDHYG
jgi:toxin YoeB